MGFPPPYGLLFLYMEPLGALPGIFVNIFAPATLLKSISPQAIAATYSALDELL